MNLHAFRWDSFVWGVLFLAISGNWWARRQGIYTLAELSVVAPLILIAAGIAGIVLSLARGRRSPADPTTSADGATTPTER